MLVGFCLFVLGFITVLSVIVGNAWTGVTTEQFISNFQILNGSISDLELQATDVIFNIDPVTGFIAGLAGLIAIATAIGINILGSGLSDQAVRIVSYAIIYGGIWTALSVLAWSLITSIALFGGIIYVVLTILFVFGVVQNLAGGGD